MKVRDEGCGIPPIHMSIIQKDIFDWLLIFCNYAQFTFYFVVFVFECTLEILET